MSRNAREILVGGLSITLQAYDKAQNDYTGDTKQLCGADSISYSDGGVEEKDVTDFCDAASGFRRKLAGLREPGSLSVNLIRYDPKQEGQKMLHDAPPNAKFKMSITGIGDDDTLTLFVKKKNNAGFEAKLGEQLSGSIEFIVERDPLWS